MTNAWARMASHVVADCHRYSPQAAMARLVRASRVFQVRDVAQRLHHNPACRAHKARVAPHDHWFYLTHRHYLARGLSVAQRAACALHHYEHEVRAFDAAYFKAVYEEQGLVLWRADVGEDAFEIRLMSGHDMMYEGGISVVPHYNGERLGVFTYSTVDPSVLLAPGALAANPERSLLFLARKQLTNNHTYQKSFNKAFERVTLAHFTFAALAGVAMAQGHGAILGVDAAHHPSYAPGYEERLQSAYDEFWASLEGSAAPPCAYRVEVPMRMPSTDQMDGEKRRRANKRRQHLEAVRASAEAALRPHLRPA